MCTVHLGLSLLFFKFLKVFSCCIAVSMLLVRDISESWNIFHTNVDEIRKVLPTSMLSSKL